MIVACVQSMGERSEGLCVELISRQVDKVHVVRGYSRWEAIYRSWELGIGSDIYVSLPCDMLVAPGAVERLADYLDVYDRVSGRCISKFRGNTVGGISVYNPNILPELMRISKEKYKDSLRPESDPIVRHFHYKVTEVMTGYHEYELDYREIYDRYVFQLKKHPAVRRMKDKWYKLQVGKNKDLDFRAAYKAVSGKEFNMGEKPPLTDYDRVIKKMRL